MVVARTFDLGELFRRIDGLRIGSGQSWASLSKQVGVAVSTIRRFETALADPDDPAAGIADGSR